VGELLTSSRDLLLLLRELADEILREHILGGVRVTDGLKLDGAVLTGAVEEGVGTTGVLVDEGGNVIDLTIKDHPKIRLLVVLGDLLEGDDLKGSGGHYF